jgi:hypothetical protein
MMMKKMTHSNSISNSSLNTARLVMILGPLWLHTLMELSSKLQLLRLYIVVRRGDSTTSFMEVVVWLIFVVVVVVLPFSTEDRPNSKKVSKASQAKTLQKNSVTINHQ